MGPLFCNRSQPCQRLNEGRKGFEILRPLFHGVWHLNNMLPRVDFAADYSFRTPAEPVIPPIQEPIDPPENPDVPIREPDPEDPGQI